MDIASAVAGKGLNYKKGFIDFPQLLLWCDGSTIIAMALCLCLALAVALRACSLALGKVLSWFLHCVKSHQDMSIGY